MSRQSPSKVQYSATFSFFGASGHGKVVADTAELVGWNEVVFLVMPGLSILKSTLEDSRSYEGIVGYNP